MRLSDLVVSPMNVRGDQKEDEGIKELAGSIKKYSLISKIILRPGAKQKFEVVAGQRRYKALLEMHGEDYELKEDEYLLRDDLEDKDAFVLSISENQQRVALSPVVLNRAVLKLNQFGFKDKEIAKILNVTAHRLKRLGTLAQDIKRMPEEAVEELKKPLEESKFNDAHLDKVKVVDNEDIVKDVVDFIIDKEAPPRDVPTIIKAIEKKYEAENPALGDENSKPAKTSVDQDEIEGPIEYKHKGELVLEKNGTTETLKVLGKGTENEAEEVPVEHYLEYLRHPDKFKCYVTFKLKVKSVE